MIPYKDVSLYLSQTHPYGNTIKCRGLIKLVYLADWNHCIRHGEQITNINWVYSDRGPMINDIFDGPLEESLNEQQKESISIIIKEMKNLEWHKITTIVYSTFPMRTTEKYKHLNLSQKIIEYNKLHRCTEI